MISSITWIGDNQVSKKSGLTAPIIGTNIKNQLLKRCTELLEEIANTPSDDYYGTPPKVFYIDFAFGDKHKIGMFIKDPLETYKYENGILEKVQTGTKYQAEPISGMYFFEGYATTGIDKDNNLAYMSFRVGRRYGRGFRYEILTDEKGIRLGAEKLMWVS